MTRPLLLGAFLLAMAQGVSGAIAQPSGAWPACRKDPSRACVLAEALGRLRDDAPTVRDLQFVEWERLLYLRLSEVAAVMKDRTLFEEARLSARANATEDMRRSALRWVATAQARSGFPDDALRTLIDGDDGGFAAGEIAIAMVRAGRIDEARRITERMNTFESQIAALIRLAQATGAADWLRLARDLVRELQDGYHQSALLARVAITYAETGQIGQAIMVAGDVAVSYHRSQALAGIAALTRDPTLFAEARRLATGFDGRGHEDEVWAALARTATALGDLQAARAILDARIPDGPSRALAAAAGELAAVYWLAGESLEAEKLIDTLLGGSWTIGEARAVLARRLINNRRFDEARRVSFLADEITFDNLSAEIALKQASSGNIRDALATADTIQHPARRAPTLAEIAAMLAD